MYPRLKWCSILLGYKDVFQVTRVDRLGAGHLNYDVTARGKQSISIDLKKKEGIQGNSNQIIFPF